MLRNATPDRQNLRSQNTHSTVFAVASVNDRSIEFSNSRIAKGSASQSSFAVRLDWARGMGV